MSITFVVLRQSGQRYDRAPLTADDSELSLSNENAHDVLDALGIETPIPRPHGRSRPFARASRPPAASASAISRRQLPRLSAANQAA
jgi:hypothetical protein